jgi:hypothetical protein
MANNHSRPVTFRQSRNDFPAELTLGGAAPAWGLSRWAGQGLRFIPPDDEGFTVRGDGKRMAYRGRKRSHRFTILGDAAFEYDCILEREPESNVITLFMEGAERFDFFRQPDCIKDPLLAGSYAVYKKETLIGEGTGKLCHIHRPEILDSRGRRCWGDLFITGNRLCVVIPEPWLANAAYPVIVDPIVGLSSLGALGPENSWGYDEEQDDEDDAYDTPSFILSANMGVNHFIMPHNSSGGDYVARLYVDYAPGSYHWSLTEDKMWPVIYDHDLTKDRPGVLLSSNGGHISNDVGRSNGPPRGWRTADVYLDGNLWYGQQFWFGFFFRGAHPRYDYGGRLFESWAWPYQNSYAGVRQKFYQYPIETETDTYIDAQGNEIEYETWSEPSYELKISMYLEYSVPATTYGRYVYEFVTPPDGLEPAGNYQRSAAQTAGAEDGAQRVAQAKRTVEESGKAATTTGRFAGYLRAIWDTETAGDAAGHTADYLRGLFLEARVVAENKHTGRYKRGVADSADIAAVLLRHLFIVVRLIAGTFIRDYIIGRFLKSREEIVIKSPVRRKITLESRL